MLTEMYGPQLMYIHAELTYIHVSVLLCIAFTKNKYFVEIPDLFLEKSTRKSP